MIASMEAQLHNLANSGTLVYVGLSKDNFSLNDTEFHKLETTLLSSRLRGASTIFRLFWIRWPRGNIRPQKMVTHTGEFQEAARLMEAWSDPANGVIKGVILY